MFQRVLARFGYVKVGATLGMSVFRKSEACGPNFFNNLLCKWSRLQVICPDGATGVVELTEAGWKLWHNGSRQSRRSFEQKDSGKPAPGPLQQSFASVRRLVEELAANVVEVKEAHGSARVEKERRQFVNAVQIVAAEALQLRGEQLQSLEAVVQNTAADAQRTEDSARQTSAQVTASIAEIQQLLSEVRFDEEQQQSLVTRIAQAVQDVVGMERIEVATVVENALDTALQPVTEKEERLNKALARLEEHLSPSLSSRQPFRDDRLVEEDLLEHGLFRDRHYGGRVVKIVDYGLYIRAINEQGREIPVDGLIHISRIPEDQPLTGFSEEDHVGTIEYLGYKEIGGKKKPAFAILEVV